MLMNYDEAFGELYKNKVECQKKANEAREDLLNKLNSEQMIRIMFARFLTKLNDKKVIDLAKINFKEWH